MQEIQLQIVLNKFENATAVEESLDAGIFNWVAPENFWLPFGFRSFPGDLSGLSDFLMDSSECSGSPRAFHPTAQIMNPKQATTRILNPEEPII